MWDANEKVSIAMLAGGILVAFGMRGVNERR